VVENKPGAGSTTAATQVARAKPDGYTVLLGASGNLAVAPNLYPTLGYDSLNDFDHVAMTGIAPLVLLVRSDSKFKSVRDLVEASKGSDNINYGSGGNGVVNHLAMELLKKTTGAKLTHIAYKGSAPSLQDLLGGQIQVMFETIPPSLPHIRSGKLRAIAVSSSSRIPLLQDVPTVAETYPAFDAAVAWTAMSVPKGVPRPIVAKLAGQMFESMNKPAVKEKLESLGSFFEPGMNEAKTKAWVVAEHAKFRKIIQDAGIKLE
jgi:tripartite-type tricarboxylate transporter receptor subunit TctC